MGDKIKTAWEKAMERFEEKNKNVTDADIMRMECLPEAQKLVGRLLAEAEFDILTTVKQYDQDRQKLIFEALEDNLVTRLVLPENEQSMQDDQRIMEGLLQIKKDKESMSPIMGELEDVFNYYLQSREQAYQSLEQEFRSRIDSAMREKGVDPGQGVQVDPARYPQFQEELTKLMGQINEKFTPSLKQIRQKIKDVD
ncbi:MAG: hypothetical protein FH756_13485 [Firmicutes bacterium]|nr:hypothetical protein [Bacillota bacterium]